MTIDEWKRILLDARGLGLERLVISGGEPTLYNHLHELVEEASQMGIHVSMNSNGNTVDKGYAEDLIRAGLTAVKISIYSQVSDIQNDFRRNRKSWANACQTMKMYSRLRERYPQFKLNTQTIILRENFLSLDELIRFHYGMGSQSVTLSYLEGDYAGSIS